MDGGHLDRENDILRRHVLYKSCSYFEDRYPEHLNSCQDDNLSSKTPAPDFVDWGHLDSKNVFLDNEDDTKDDIQNRANILFLIHSNKAYKYTK